jgi:kumamolisin
MRLDTRIAAAAGAFAAAVALVACGGGGGSSGGGPPTVLPTKSPTAAPTQAPTATPTQTPGASEPSPVAPGPIPSGTPLLTGYEYILGSQPDEGGWLTTALADSFEYPVQYGYGGAGQTIAIIGAAFPAQSDLSSFWSLSGIPVPAINFDKYSGGNSSPSKDEIDEATLDTETVGGLAPKAVTDVIEMPSLSDQYIAPTIEYALNQGATVVSMSFGGCESDDLDADQAIDSIAQEASATGVTLVAAAGDSGPTCDNGASNGVQEPASDPYVVGAGGTESLFNVGQKATQAQINADLQNPAPWNETAKTDNPQGAGGGGVSAIWGLPSWQYAPGAASSTMRNVPDFSLPASLDGPAAVYLNGEWYLIGGTSWSTPQFAAMQAEINQVCGKNRWGLPDLYRIHNQYPAAFIDVTTGEISWPGSSLVYAALPGYDNASGLGMPLGIEIAIYDGC